MRTWCGRSRGRAGAGGGSDGYKLPRGHIIQGNGMESQSILGESGRGGAQAKPGSVGILIREFFIHFGGQNGCE